VPHVVPSSRLDYFELLPECVDRYQESIVQSNKRVLIFSVAQINLYTIQNPSKCFTQIHLIKTLRKRFSFIMKSCNTDYMVITCSTDFVSFKWVQIFK